MSMIYTLVDKVRVSNLAPFEMALTTLMSGDAHSSRKA